jgi:predicted adenylyl cyclase CyaB
MREGEVKGVFENEAAAARASEALRVAGARLVFKGRLEDKRYDRDDRSLALRDHVLRLRVYRTEAVRALLDFKGPTEYDGAYKVREEHSVEVGDPQQTATLLEALGYVVTREIDREIEQYELAGATVRFERYPRMDILVEVEGTPEAIEGAIEALGVARAAFTAERLPDFVVHFETRTGERAALCDRELTGDYRYSATDA